MDKTSVWFNIAGNFTIEEISAKTCSISNAMNGLKDDKIYYDEIFNNRTHQTFDEICYNKVLSENIIIIDFSKDEDDNTNQDIFVEDDEEVLIFATNQ
ncbi:10418_t:CDS:2 [Cetraspora pellucida]|uniref:10418_t:CDS:1 n=1 Tax=Cetraspora pellucida TaxID=1433469 RepID=A0A9N9DDT7_9GLOM|nr:10418_t:CDS:2 [Cetraspora pellucida]